MSGYVWTWPNKTSRCLTELAYIHEHMHVRETVLTPEHSPVAFCR